MEVSIKGNSVHELISNLICANRVLGKEPNTVIMSTAMASQLVFESGVEHSDGGPLWKKAIGSTIFGLKVLVVEDFNKPELLELWKMEE